MWISCGMGWAVIHDHQEGFALLFGIDDCPSHPPQLNQGHFWSRLVGTGPLRPLKIPNLTPAWGLAALLRANHAILASTAEKLWLGLLGLVLSDYLMNNLRLPFILSGVFSFSYVTSLIRIGYPQTYISMESLWNYLDDGESIFQKNLFVNECKLHSSN